MRSATYSWNVLGFFHEVQASLKTFFHFNVSETQTVKSKIFQPFIWKSFKNSFFEYEENEQNLKCKYEIYHR